MSRHALSSIKDEGWLIDKILESLYVKNGRSHFVLNIEKEGDIQLSSLTTFVSTISRLATKISEHFELGEQPETSAIKLQLQSPGSIEIILEKGKSLIILAAILSITACSGTDTHLNIPQEEKQELHRFMDINEQDINAIKNEMDTLQVNKDKINSI